MYSQVIGSVVAYKLQRYIFGGCLKIAPNININATVPSVGDTLVYFYSHISTEA